MISGCCFRAAPWSQHCIHHQPVTISAAATAWAYAASVFNQTVPCCAGLQHASMCCALGNSMANGPPGWHWPKSHMKTVHAQLGCSSLKDACCQPEACTMESRAWWDFVSTCTITVVMVHVFCIVAWLEYCLVLFQQTVGCPVVATPCILGCCSTFPLSCHHTSAVTAHDTPFIGADSVSPGVQPQRLVENCTSVMDKVLKLTA